MAQDTEPDVETPPEEPAVPENVPEAPERPAVAPVVVPRWVQMVMLPLAVIGAYGVVRAAGPVVLLFVVAGLIALLLNPVVALLQRARVPRGPAVALVVVGVVAVLTGIGFLLSNPVSDQVSSFQRQVPHFVDDANSTLASLQSWLDGKGIDVQVKRPGQTALETLGNRLNTGSGDILNFTRDALQTLVEGGIALILVIVLSVYMLLYGRRIGAVVRRIVPPGDGTPEDDFPTRVQAAVFGYVRGQLLFSLIMGTSAGIMLWILGSLGIFPTGKTYAFAFGAWYGFAELIPYVGPAIGGFPPVAIAALGPQPLDAVWLIIAFVVLQQLEGHIVAPTVFGQALRINPILVILALLLGGQLYGFIGAFTALPIAAILRETVVYMRRHLAFERWDLLAVQPEPPPQPPAGRCPDCGAPRRPGSTVCPECGSELGGEDEAASAAASAPG